MVKGIHTSGGAMRAALVAQEILANNLANAGTTGFRQTKTAFRLSPAMGPPTDGAAPTAPMPEVVTRMDQAPGAFQVTEAPLDFAIRGDGFFAVQTDDGERYTRGGHFRLAEDGTLVTSQGHPVLADGGPVVVPLDAQLEVGADGSLIASGQSLGRLQVITFEEGTGGLRYVGSGLLAADGEPVPAEDAQVLQGVLESPNVSPVQAMVDMIALMRHFEMNQRAIRTQDETLGRLIDWARG